VRTKDNAVQDSSDAPFSISAMKVIRRVPPERMPPLLLKFSRLEVRGIDLAPGAEGFNIFFSYRKSGEAVLPDSPIHRIEADAFMMPAV
jgi:hypothetical protein